MNLRRAFTARDLLREVEDGSVLIADELTPSFAAQVDWTKVRGFATDVGSRTYHTAILARTLEVPALVGLHDASRLIQPGQIVALDADAGELIVDPDADLVGRLKRREQSHAQAADGTRQEPASTADGVRIQLDANIEFPGDLAAARYAAAENIGLYRSEFLLSGGAGPLPSEDNQYATYREMLEGMAPGQVTIRTFDADDGRVPGREAEAPTDAEYESAWSAHQADNHRIGLRGVRLRLTRPDLFRTQLRALLRAAPHGSLRILFPFVSGVEELRDARRTVTQVASELTREGHVVPRVPIGIMIEVPSAAYTADLLAREVDFFTIGTNDLVQYCLAVDRADDRVSRLYEPLNPAILRVIFMIRRAAARARIPVSLCGEMASDPALLPLLVGLGLREFSMTPGAIGVAKRVLADLRIDELRRLARRVLGLSTATDIEQELLATLGRLTV
jgi:phosphotransferase system enzyme I (PtsI)